MSKTEWFKQAIENKESLKILIKNYHPANLVDRRGNKLSTKAKITATMAEVACANIREEVRKNWEGDPVVEFQNALDSQDERMAYKILSDTWFGVPESTSCWNLIGFRECVDLLDDPIDNPHEDESIEAI